MVLEKDGEDQLADHVRNEDVLIRVKEQRNILHEIVSGRLNWSHFAWKMPSTTGY